MTDHVVAKDNDTNKQINLILKLKFKRLQDHKKIKYIYIDEIYNLDLSTLVFINCL